MSVSGKKKYLIVYSCLFSTASVAVSGAVVFGADELTLSENRTVSSLQAQNENRKRMRAFTQLLSERNLIGTRRSRLDSILGRHSIQSGDFSASKNYELVHSASLILDLEVQYQNDQVEKYRYSTMPAGVWNDSSLDYFTNTGYLEIDRPASDESPPFFHDGVCRPDEDFFPSAVPHKSYVRPFSPYKRKYPLR